MDPEANGGRGCCCSRRTHRRSSCLITSQIRDVLFFDRATQHGTRNHPNSHPVTSNSADNNSKPNHDLSTHVLPRRNIIPGRLSPPVGSRLKASARQPKPTITDRSQQPKKKSGGLLRRRMPMLSPCAPLVSSSSPSIRVSNVACSSRRGRVMIAIRARSARGCVVRACGQRQKIAHSILRTKKKDAESRHGFTSNLHGVYKEGSS